VLTTRKEENKRANVTRKKEKHICPNLVSTSIPLTAADQMLQIQTTQYVEYMIKRVCRA